MATSPTYGVSFSELDGSPRVHISSQGMTATRIFICPWSSWEDLAHEIIGIYKIVSGTVQLIKHIPFPNQPNLVPDEVAVEPLMPDSPDGNTSITLGSTLQTYDNIIRGGVGVGARLTVTYRTRFDDQSNSRSDLPSIPQGTYLTYATDLGAELMTIPGRAWKWTGVAIPGGLLGPDAHVGVLIPSGSYSLVWHRVLQPPFSAIRDLRGKVNSSTFLGGPAETVLFLGAQISREFQFISDGGYWRVEYRFAESMKELNTAGTYGGWNHFWKPEKVSGNHWVKVEAADDATVNPYQTADFAPLFAYGTV